MAKPIDVLKHAFVPEHVVLPEEEAEALLEKYDIRPEQLPRILASDPCAMAVGAEPGDILKIRRNSQVAGYNVAYRLCVGA